MIKTRFLSFTLFQSTQSLRKYRKSHVSWEGHFSVCRLLRLFHVFFVLQKRLVALRSMMDKSGTSSQTTLPSLGKVAPTCCLHPANCTIWKWDGLTSQCQYHVTKTASCLWKGLEWPSRAWRALWSLGLVSLPRWANACHLGSSTVFNGFLSVWRLSPFDERVQDFDVFSDQQNDCNKL